VDAAGAAGCDTGVAPKPPKAETGGVVEAAVVEAGVDPKPPNAEGGLAAGAVETGFAPNPPKTGGVLTAAELVLIAGGGVAGTAGDEAAPNPKAGLVGFVGWAVAAGVPKLKLEEG
jgi:hypothetical protein